MCVRFVNYYKYIIRKISLHYLPQSLLTLLDCVYDDIICVCALRVYKKEGKNLLYLFSALSSINYFTTK